MVLINSSTNSDTLIDGFYNELLRSLDSRTAGTGNLNSNGNSNNIGQNSKIVQVLVHTDLDALCTCRILISLFKQDGVQYEIIPISAYADLRELEVERMSCIVCLNVGGMVNLVDYFGLDSSQHDSTWWIIDSHRPLNLHNLFSSTQIMVLDDGTVAEDVKGLRRAFEAMEFDEDPEDDDEDEDEDDQEEGEEGDDENDENDAEPGDENDDDQNDGEDEASFVQGGQTKKDDTDDSSSDEENEESESGENNVNRKKEDDDEKSDVTRASAGMDEDDISSPSKRRKVDKTDVDDEDAEEQEEEDSPATKLAKEKAARRNEKRMYREMISDYYGQGSGFGMPVSHLAYTLATGLGRGCQDHLWWTIISSTSNYIYGKSSALEYTTMAKDYKDEVDRLSLNTNAPLSITDDPDDYQIPTSFTPRVASGPSSSTPSLDKEAENTSIRFIQDFQLVLLKHWNLYDSLFHSSYVATKLGVWREKGRQRLTNMLVKMGFPQLESRQYYKQMDMVYKKLLAPKLNDWAPRYDMPDIAFPSFDRGGLNGVFSASDVVYSMTALLDCGCGLLASKGVTGYEAALTIAATSSNLLLSNRAKHAFQDASESGDGGLIGAGVGTGTISAIIGSKAFEKVHKGDNDGRPEWIRNFYLAYDALSSPPLLQHGILLAIRYQRLLVETAMSILEKKLVRSLKHFQLTILKGSGGGGGQITGDGGEARIFGTSIPMLYRLTTFLIDAYQIHRDKRLPFVCVAYNEENNSYLVLGRAVHSARKNPFGLAFLEAAERTGVEIQHDFFDSSCINVAKDNIGVFLENLQLTIV